jgi:6-phosphofructokinase 1
MTVKRIGVLTGGGDCPGLNAVIRAVSKTLMHEYDAEIVGFLDGFDGLVRDRTMPLDWEAASGILTQGGTILGTSNKANPFEWHERTGDETATTDRSDDALRVFERHDLEALVVIGGDGSMNIAARLSEKGMPVVGVPKTIDNDVPGTELTFGFQSAVDVATDALDRLHTTASAHHRVMVAEVMGRYAGWIALHAGIASGSDVVLLPEIPFRWETIFEVCHERAGKGRSFSIVCVAEGARPKGGEMVIRRRVEGSPDPVRLGGVGRLVAGSVEQETGIETRATVLGYVQRGGTPCPFDRVFATSLGYQAVRLVNDSRWGRMVSWQKGRLTDVSLSDVAGESRKIPADHPLLAVARAVGTCFGE